MKSFFQNLPIRLKFTIPMVVALSLMLLSANFYFPRFYRRILVDAYTRDAQKNAELLSVAAQHGLEQHDFELIYRTLQRSRKNPNILYIIYLDETGEEIARHNPTNMRLPDDILRRPSPSRQEEIIIATQPLTSTVGDSLGYLIVGYSLQPLNRQIKAFQLATIAFTIVSFTLGYIFIQELSDRITVSVSKLEKEMQEIMQQGSYAGHVSVASKDEIGRLAAVFNEMMAELQTRHENLVASREALCKLNEQLHKINQLKTVFVSDASHHLRTPLTIITGEVDVALRQTRSIDEYEETLRIIREETTRLKMIVENLLDLAKADAGTLVVMQDDIDLSEICTRCAHEFQAFADRKNVRLQHNIARKCYMCGDPARLEELVSILLENAIKYTPPGESVHFVLKNGEKKREVRIADTGIGIPEDEIDKIFDRFYRGRNTLSSSAGTGLGLAICKMIVDAHGGAVRVSSTPGKGSTFSVLL